MKNKYVRLEEVQFVLLSVCRKTQDIKVGMHIQFMVMHAYILL